MVLLGIRFWEKAGKNGKRERIVNKIPNLSPGPKQGKVKRLPPLGGRKGRQITWGQRGWKGNLRKREDAHPSLTPVDYKRHRRGKEFTSFTF